MKGQHYKDIANKIIKDSIKSVAFIDEKAVEFFSTKPNHKIPEERLSENLYKNFKEIGISLTIDKFDKLKNRDANYYSYILKKKDLILLDWKLDGEEGIQYSLEILSKIIETNHLHFCSIYTSEGNHDIILNNLRSYFSGYSKQNYDDVREGLEEYGDDLNQIIKKIDYNPKKNGSLYSLLIELDKELPSKVKQLTKCEDIKDALIQVKLSFEDFCKSETAIEIPKFIDSDSKSINLKSTIVTIVNKSQDNPEKILNKLTNQLVNTPNSFMEILGLDMQNKFSENSSFIDPRILNISFNALLHHRKQLLENISENEFKNFIFSILLEQSKLTLSNSNLDVLETSFLEEETKELEEVSNEEICLLNTFYNGSVLDKERLNFGDILLDSKSNLYYLCITPLCDCLHPENVKNNLFFVTGTKAVDIEECIDSGDSGFKSYIDNQTCIMWTKTQYIKPFQMHVPELSFKNDELHCKLFKNNELNDTSLRYVFTLKNSYAQRIANHAFNYPIRVGVDFVKREVK